MDKLPKGWVNCHIEDVAKSIQYGFTGKTIDNGNVKYLRITDIQNNFVDWNQVPFVEIGTKETDKYFLRANDIVFARTGATAGKSFLIEKLNCNSVFASYLIRIVPRIDKIFPKYLYLYFQSPEYWSHISGNVEGAAQPNFNGKKLAKIPFPLPPLSEQIRIVSKLDTLFARIDQSITMLEENIKHTKGLMASVLEELFEKLHAKRHRVKDISKSIQYGYTGQALEKGEYYYLRITDIQNGKVDFSHTPYSDIPVEQIEKYVLNQGDILFARTGATAGKSYLFLDNEKSVFASYLIRVVCNKNVLIPNYLYCYFQSKGYWNQIFDNIVGAAQPNFNGKKLGEIKLPLPDLFIQQQIVDKYELLNKSSENLSNEQQSKLTYLKALKSSLLDRAFKGEL